jgi:hypothetical protein
LAERRPFKLGKGYIFSRPFHLRGGVLLALALEFRLCRFELRNVRGDIFPFRSRAALIVSHFYHPV